MAAVWAPFAEQVDDDEAVNFKQVIGQTVGAIVQVATTGTPDQREKAIEILGDTRRRLYGLLAEGPDASEDIDDDVGLRGGVMDSLRISDADRAAAVDLLSEQYAEGRLTRDEFDERSDAVWSAKTRGDLAPVFVDLPVRSPAEPATEAVSLRRALGFPGAGDGPVSVSGDRADDPDPRAVRAVRTRAVVRAVPSVRRAPPAVGRTPPPGA